MEQRLGRSEAELQWRAFILQKQAKNANGLAPLALITSMALRRSWVRLLREPFLQPLPGVLYP